MARLILYHFTTHVLYPRIEREGLTKGRVPWALVANRKAEGTKVRMMQGLQWLTEDPEFDTQLWSFKSRGAAAMMRKNDWRITIEVPNLASYKLYHWPDFAAHHHLGFAEAADKEFGSKHTRKWYVFNGPIPVGWFVQTLQNPELRDLVDEFGPN